MKLRSVFTISFLLIGSIVVGVQSVAAIGHMVILAKTREAEAVLNIDRALVSLVETLAPERGATTGLIAKRVPGDPKQAAALGEELAKVRAKTEALREVLERRLTETNFSGRDGIAAEVSTLLGIRADLMRRADILMAQDQRDAKVGVAWTDEQITMIDRFSALFLRLNSLMIERVTQAGVYIDLVTKSAALRDWAGRQSLVVVGGIASHGPVGPETLRQFDVAHGRSLQSLSELDVALSQPGTPVSLSAAMERTRTGYQKQLFPLLASMREGLSGATPYVMDLAAYRAASQPALGAFTAVRDEALDRAEAEVAAESQQAVRGLWTNLGVLTLFVGVIIAVGLLLDRRIIRPLISLTSTVGSIATGARNLVVPYIEHKDEVGEMARAIATLQDNSARADQRAAAESEQQALREQRAERLEGLVGTFEVSVDATVTELSGASAQLETTARAMSETASQANQKAVAVAEAASRASGGAQEVATAAEELSASIHEISRQVLHSASITGAAVEHAKRVGVITKALTVSADRIGDVVALIASIASQTNLLALNATIEAARAGDAGKGFAVVASEVKNLASQTGRATDEIRGQITAIQSATKDTVEAVGGISRSIEEVSGIATDIASAVEQQGAATAEIARHVQNTAEAARVVTEIIVGVRTAAGETGVAATEVLEAATGLSQQSSQLSSQVSGFVGDVRSA